MHFRTARHALAVTLAAGALAGCGSTTDVSGGVEDTNKDLAAQGAKLECPKEVSGGEGTEFDCKMISSDGSKSIDVKLKVIKQGDDLALAPVSETEYNKAIGEVGKPAN